MIIKFSTSFHLNAFGEQTVHESFSKFLFQVKSYIRIPAFCSKKVKYDSQFYLAFMKEVLTNIGSLR